MHYLPIYRSIHPIIHTIAKQRTEESANEPANEPANQPTTNQPSNQRTNKPTNQQTRSNQQTKNQRTNHRIHLQMYQEFSPDLGLPQLQLHWRPRHGEATWFFFAAVVVLSQKVAARKWRHGNGSNNEPRAGNFLWTMIQHGNFTIKNDQIWEILAWFNHQSGDWIYHVRCAWKLRIA